jgi:hypothetical protein
VCWCVAHPERCRREIAQLDDLGSDAKRYFSRLSHLIQLVLAAEPHSG